VRRCASSGRTSTSRLSWFAGDATSVLGHVHGDLDALKAACASREDCAGFNSAGSLFGSGDLHPTHKSIDFYVKMQAALPVGLWPMPSSLTNLDGTVVHADSSSFEFHAADGSSTPVLEKAFGRYRNLAFLRKLPTPPTAAVAKKPAAAASTLTGLTVSVSNTGAPLTMGMDESYSLTIPSTGGDAILQAKTTWGALRGLERFSQLVHWSGYDSAFDVFVASITDAPRFSHRGLLIDTSRHFMRLDAIFMAIDTLVYNFYSVLHWHIVDDQSFPYNSTTFPELAAQGAYNAPYDTHIYSQEDVQAVIEYATDRGIRVLAEFDTPGHTESWGISHPELLVPCYSNGKPDGSRYGVNPLLNTTYDFMKQFWSEIAQVFPDSYVHVGGDELELGPGSCWTTNPQLQAWMKAHGETDYAALENLYEQQFVPIVSATGKSLIGWQELYDNGIDLPADFVVNVWKGGWQDEMANVTQRFKAILSSPFYENYIQNPYDNGGDWAQYYLVEPLDFSGSAAQYARVMGCETSFWAEYIDSTNFFSRAWPRASASGERFWSPATVNDPLEAATRLHSHRCRLINRGIPAEPVLGPSYCVEEWDVAYAPPF
jgi:hexosaminidase